MRSQKKMNRTEKEFGNVAKGKTNPKTKKTTVEKMGDVQRLVHLLQVHQVELEHQNEELRITQQELEVSRNKYVNLFDFSPIPYFTLNSDGLIKEVNLSAGKMFGTDRKKLIGKNLILFIQQNERDIFKLFLNSIFSSPIKHSCELTIKNKEKRLFHVLLEGLKIEDTMETDPGCQVALIDLTDYKRVEDSLKKSTEELKILNATKDKFFSIIAHDLKSPFQGFLGTTELMSEEVNQFSNSDLSKLSSEMHKSAQSLLKLLKNLLDWAQIQNNTIDFEPKDCNLKKIVDQNLEIMGPIALQKGITVFNEVPENLKVFADENMLNSILRNLLSNSVKFTFRNGKIVINAKAASNNMLEISVRDTGIGMSENTIKKLFKIDEKIGTKGTDGEPSSSLGLLLCKEFVEKHGGKIRVESETGKGSVFYFTV